MRAGGVGCIGRPTHLLRRPPLLLRFGEQSALTGSLRGLCPGARAKPRQNGGHVMLGGLWRYGELLRDLRVEVGTADGLRCVRRDLHRGEQLRAVRQKFLHVGGVVRIDDRDE